MNRKIDEFNYVIVKQFKNLHFCYSLNSIAVQKRSKCSDIESIHMVRNVSITTNSANQYNHQSIQHLRHE